MSGCAEKRTIKVLLAALILLPNVALARQLDETALRASNAADLILSVGYAISPAKLLEFGARGPRGQDEIASDGVRVRVARQPPEAVNGPTQLELTIEAAGVAPFTYRLKEAYGMFVQIAHLKAPSGRPEVLVRTDHGTSGIGHYELTIFSTSPSTTSWTKIPTDCCVGDLRLGVAHSNTLGSGYFLDFDLNRGTPDADDMKKAGVRDSDILFDEPRSVLAATYRVLTLGDKGIVDVTRNPEYRAIQAYRLKEWFADVGKQTEWKADPKSPGWQALALRYVKIKALLGEFQDGWSFFVGDAGYGTNDEFTRLVKAALIKTGFATEGEFPPIPTANAQPLSRASAPPSGTMMKVPKLSAPKGTVQGGSAGITIEQFVESNRKAAAAGDASAQVELGLMYANGGRGVAKDQAQAVAWYRKAAEQGNALAQELLATMYAKGSGVAKDKVQAAAWYRKAAEQGNEAAKKKLKELNPQ
jgi:hypothetical protein